MIKASHHDTDYREVIGLRRGTCDAREQVFEQIIAILVITTLIFPVPL